jgi:hypothetical protein
MNITKEKFEEVVNKYPQNSWIKFAFKHFSKKEDKSKIDWSKIGNWSAFILIILFLIGFIGTILNAPRWIILYSTVGYSLFLSIVVFYLLSALLMDDFRLKKIMKELGITPKQYVDLIREFYN